MRLFNLLWLPIASLVGASYIAQAKSPKLPSQPTETPQAWKIQPVTMPTIDKKSAHQALLLRQKQLAGKTFSCDCYSCRLAAKQLGITLN